MENCNWMRIIAIAESGIWRLHPMRVAFFAVAYITELMAESKGFEDVFVSYDGFDFSIDQLVSPAPSKFKVLPSESNLPPSQQTSSIKWKREEVLKIEDYRPLYADGIIDNPLVGEWFMNKSLVYKTATDESTIFFPLMEFDRYQEADADTLLW